MRRARDAQKPRIRLILKPERMTVGVLRCVLDRMTSRNCGAALTRVGPQRERVAQFEGREDERTTHLLRGRHRRNLLVDHARHGRGLDRSGACRSEREGLRDEGEMDESREGSVDVLRPCENAAKFSDAARGAESLAEPLREREETWRSGGRRLCGVRDERTRRGKLVGRVEAVLERLAESS